MSDGVYRMDIRSGPYGGLGIAWRLLLEHGFVNQNYELIYDTRTPDMVLMSGLMSKHHVKGNASQIARLARELFGPGPQLLFRCGEAITPGDQIDDFNYVFSSRPDRDNNICIGEWSLPGFITWMQNNDMDTGMTRSNPKSRFCNYIYGYKGRFGVSRASFCRKLMRYKHVDCPGPSLNNMRFPQPPPHPHRYIEKLHFIKDYKFTIAFENQSLSGYITEKISHPLAVGSIPIYWGCPEAADYYNPKAFINCHDYPDFDAVIEHVKEVDNNPELYAEYINAPPSLPGQHYYMETIIDRCRRVADNVYAEAVRRRGAEG